MQKLHLYKVADDFFHMNGNKQSRKEIETCSLGPINSGEQNNVTLTREEEYTKHHVNRPAAWLPLVFPKLLDKIANCGGKGKNWLRAPLKKKKKKSISKCTQTPNMTERSRTTHKHTHAHRGALRVAKWHLQLLLDQYLKGAEKGSLSPHTRQRRQVNLHNRDCSSRETNQWAKQMVYSTFVRLTLILSRQQEQ